MEKYRIWNGREMEYSIVVGKYGVFYVNPEKGDGLDPNDSASLTPNTTKYPDDIPLMKSTEILDKNGNEIWFGDKLRFTYKWEWYKGKYGIKMYFADTEKRSELQKQYDSEPYEERIVDSVGDYEWLLGSEIQQYWEVVGNKYENNQ